MKRIGVISDTHGCLREQVLAQLASCDVILHAGDVDRDGILQQLKALAPVYAVRGNADEAWANDLPVTLDLQLQGRNIFLIHDKKQIQESLTDRDIIIYGHSHRYEENWVGRQLWLNPGSCGARRFWLPVTMAVLQLQSDGGISVERIDLLQAASSAKRCRPQAILRDAAVIGRDGKTVVAKIMEDVDRGRSVQQIAAKYHLSQETAEQICRLYLTHPGVDVEGILNRIELGLR